jgi:hypothetical protein
VGECSKRRHRKGKGRDCESNGACMITNGELYITTNVKWPANLSCSNSRDRPDVSGLERVYESPLKINLKARILSELPLAA